MNNEKELLPSEHQEKHDELLINTALLAGKLLMESGAETGRVENTMEYILNNSAEYAGKGQTYVLLNSIFAGLDDLRTGFLPVVKRDYNLTKVMQVNQLSRDFSQQKLSLSELNSKLKEVQSCKMKTLTLSSVFFAALLATSCCLLQSGTWLDVPGSCLAGIVSYCIYHLTCNFLDLPFVSEFISTFLGGVAGYILMKLIGGNPDMIMLGAVIPLVPGIAITNSIRDLLSRHYITGMIRFLECILIATALALGVVAVYLLFSL